MAYNVFYTSVPVLVSVLDKDLSEETVMQHPQILFYCQAGRFAIKLLLVLTVLNATRSYYYCIIFSSVQLNNFFLSLLV